MKKRNTVFILYVTAFMVSVSAIVMGVFAWYTYTQYGGGQYVQTGSMDLSLTGWAPNSYYEYTPGDNLSASVNANFNMDLTYRCDELSSLRLRVTYACYRYIGNDYETEPYQTGSAQDYDAYNIVDEETGEYLQHWENTDWDQDVDGELESDRLVYNQADAADRVVPESILTLRMRANGLDFLPVTDEDGETFWLAGKWTVVNGTRVFNEELLSVGDVSVSDIIERCILTGDVVDLNTGRIAVTVTAEMRQINREAGLTWSPYAKLDLKL